MDQIIVKVDDYNEIAEILLNEETIYMGNFWEFHSGNILDWGSFNGYNALAKAIKNKLEKRGKKAKIIKEKYNFNKKAMLYEI